MGENKRHEELMANKKMFAKIIDKWLKIRDESTDRSLYEPSEEDKHKPKYVMSMIQEINEKMPTPMLDKISAVETRSAGHIDYFSKFSLYCAELYMFGKSPEYWS